MRLSIPSADRLLLKRGSTLLVSNGASQLLAFLTSTIIARLLGVTDFGQYTAVMALVFVLNIVAEAGLEATLTREIARRPDQATALLFGSLRAKGLIGTLLALLLVLPPVAAALAPGANAIPAVQLAGLLVLLTGWNASYAAVFRAWGRMGNVLLINVAGLSVQLVGTVILLTTAPSLPLLVAWLIIVQVGELAGGVLLFRRGATSLGWGANVSTSADTGKGTQPEGDEADTGGTGKATEAPSITALLRLSWPFFIAGILGVLTIRVDLFLIEVLRGNAAVGVWSVATRLHEMLGFVPNSFFAVLFPALAAAHGASGVAASRQAYSRAVRGMAIGGVIAAVTGLVFADLLVWLTFGPQYAGAASSLRLLALLLIPLLINRTTTIHLYATGRAGLANRVQVVDLALRGLLGWWLVSPLGPPGAALADLAAECVVLSLFWVVLRHERLALPQSQGLFTL